MNNRSHGNRKAALFGRKRTIAMLSLALIAILALTANSSATGNFTPTISLETSTTRATAHPDARITIDNTSSSEDLRDLTIDLPKGLLGSLDAAEQCTAGAVATLTCPANSKIGDVTNFATVDNSDVVLRGEVFLTEAHNPADPAGLQIVVPAMIGGVDMGTVHVEARVQIRYGALPGGFPANAPGRIEGVRTIVTDIPREITDDNARTVEFSLKKLVVDLKSDQQAPYGKLLTNASICSTNQISAVGTSYDNTNESMSQDYTVDQCDSVVYKNPDLDFVTSTTAANSEFGFSASFSFPEDSPSTRLMVLTLGPAIGESFAGLGDSTFDQCPGSSGQSNTNFNAFDPTDCPEQAMIGSVEIETPLLPEPLIGEIYLISKSPVPNVGLYIDETTGPNNPSGVTLGLVGTSSSALVPAGCVADDNLSAECKSALTVTFNGLPDAPLSSVKVTVDGPSRAGQFASLSGKILRFPTASSADCQPNHDVVGSLTSHLGSTVRASAIDDVQITGCTARPIEMPGAPYGGVTTSTTPSLAFTSSEATNYCSIDARVAADPLDPDADPETDDDQTCGSPFSPAAPLGPGLHRLFVFGGIEALTGYEESWRAFIVEPASTADVTAPIAAIDSGPAAATTDTSPTWSFSANESAFFQCSVDGSAFLPCDAGAGAGTAGTFEIDEAAPFYSGTSHNFAVRAQDEAGNVGNPVDVDIDVEVDFAPSLSTTLTTTQARANPDLDVKISSLSNEDLKSVKLALPDGFFGGLTGVQSLCPLATAAAGNCTSASQVGTVETEARVDESLIRIDGQVYLTESDVSGEPAGLSIKVPAVIQSVDLGDIIVAGRLQVRGQAQGIDSVVIDIPDRIVPTNGFDSETQFDMREITLKLRTGAGASHPLLTNPSSCNGSAFIANFTGYEDSATADANGFAATGCEAIGFSPNLAMSVVDSTSGQPPVNGSSTKAVSANLTATLSANPGDAGIKDVSILMPRPLTINVLAIPPACKLAEYNNGAGQCPETSRVGSVSAVSPLLPEALTGSVYLLLQNDPARAVPRLLIALRGRINIDIIADNRFENSTQIRTTFSNLPDVPLSVFTLQVDKVLSTRNEACTVPADEWAATGQMAAFNGKSVPVNNQLVFGCQPKYAFTYRKRAKKTVFNVTAVGGPQKMRKLTVRLPKYVSPIKRGLKRKLVVTADGKRLSSQCYKVSRTTFTVSLCGKTASTIIARFRSGSLSAGRKAPTTKQLKKLSLSGVDTSDKRISFTK